MQAACAEAADEELALLQPACFRCGCSGALDFLQVAALPCACATMCPQCWEHLFTLEPSRTHQRPLQVLVCT